jgi:hypothetical protein
MEWCESGPPKVKTPQGKQALKILSNQVGELIDTMMCHESDIDEETQEEDRTIVACYIEDLRNFKSVVDQSLKITAAIYPKSDDKIPPVDLTRDNVCASVTEDGELEVIVDSENKK